MATQSGTAKATVFFCAIIAIAIISGICRLLLDVRKKTRAKPQHQADLILRDPGEGHFDAKLPPIGPFGEGGPAYGAPIASFGGYNSRDQPTLMALFIPDLLVLYNAPENSSGSFIDSAFGGRLRSHDFKIVLASGLRAVFYKGILVSGILRLEDFEFAGLVDKVMPIDKMLITKERAKIVHSDRTEEAQVYLFKDKERALSGLRYYFVKYFNEDGTTLFNDCITIPNRYYTQIRTDLLNNQPRSELAINLEVLEELATEFPDMAAGRSQNQSDSAPPPTGPVNETDKEAAANGPSWTAEFQSWKANMASDFAAVKQFESKVATDAVHFKYLAWEQFLMVYGAEGQATPEENMMRQYALQRKEYWERLRDRPLAPIPDVSAEIAAADSATSHSSSDTVSPPPSMDSLEHLPNDSSSAMLLAPLRWEDLDAGCSCSFYDSAESMRARRASPIISGDLDGGTIVISYRGTVIKLGLASATRELVKPGKHSVGDGYKRVYTSSRVRLELNYSTTFVCPEAEPGCEVEEYQGTVRVTEATLTYTQEIHGQCGC